MRFAFATCVQLGRSVIEKIYALGGSFEFLITLNDEIGKNKSGRVYLDDIAEKQNISLLKVKNINEQKVINTIKQNDIDWLFIIGWSQIAKEELLNTPKKGCIGMHPTLLPKGRGRASIPWAILKGLTETGVTLFRLDAGVDTGDILGQYVIPLKSDITATELYEKVVDAHIRLIEKYWSDIVSDTIVLQAQDDRQATIWPGRHPEDGKLESTMTAAEAERLVRAVTRPYPGAFYVKGNKKIIVWSAEISDRVPEEGKHCFPCSDGYLIPVDWEIEEIK